MTDAEAGQLLVFDAEDEAVVWQHTLPSVGGVQASFTGDHAVLSTATGIRLVVNRWVG